MQISAIYDIGPQSNGSLCITYLHREREMRRILLLCDMSCVRFQFILIQDIGITMQDKNIHRVALT